MTHHTIFLAMPAPELTQDKKKSLRRKYLFLGEDDEDDVEILLECLQKLDQHIEMFVLKSGQQTLSYLESLPEERLPGLILLDYNLPEISGYQILITLAGLEKYKSVPKIIWSTSNSPFHIKECLDSGALNYFVKPSEIAGFYLFAQEIIDILHGP